MSDKFEVKLNSETGEISVNLLDVIKDLSDEAREELMSDSGYWAFVSSGLQKDLRNGLATTSFEPQIFELRRALLTSDAIHDVIREFCEGMVIEMNHAMRIAGDYRDAYFKIYHYFKEHDEERNFIRLALEHRDHPLAKTKFVENFIETFLAENGLQGEQDEQG